MKWPQPQTDSHYHDAAEHLPVPGSTSVPVYWESHITLSPRNDPDTPHPALVPLTGEGDTRTMVSGCLRLQTMEAAR